MADTNTRNTGRVKWFNNKAGYGFITWSGTTGSDEDVFVHHTALATGQDQFRYLVEGEYVTFSITTADEKTTAVNVTGPDGGKLMCETRRERRQQNDERRAARDTSEAPNASVQGRKKTSTFRGGGPRSGDNERILVKMADKEDGTVWELVRRGGTNSRKRRTNTRTQSDSSTAGNA